MFVSSEERMRESLSPSPMGTLSRATGDLDARVSDRIWEIRQSRSALVRATPTARRWVAVATVGGMIALMAVCVAIFGPIFGGGVAYFIGAIVGVLTLIGLSTYFPLRPIHAWHKRLKALGFSPSDDASYTTEVRLPLGIEDLSPDYHYRMGADDAPELLVLRVGVDYGLVVHPDAPPVGDPAFDAHFGAKGPISVRALITAPLRAALLPFAGQAHLIDGELRIRLAPHRPKDLLSSPLPARLGSLHAALHQLAADAEDDLAGCHRVAQTTDAFDAGRALAVLDACQQDLPATPWAEFVRALLRGDASAALDLGLPDEAIVLRGVVHAEGEATAWRPALIDALAALPADGPGTMRALALAGVIDHPTPARWARLRAVGGVAAVHWLGARRWPASHAAEARESLAALVESTGMHGALSVGADAGGGLAISDPPG